MTSKQLPEVRKGTAKVVRLATALASDIASAVMPGTGVLREAIIQIVEKRLRAAETTLLERLRSEGIGELDDESLDQFVPSAFRFYQAARDGEINRILRLLARFISTGCAQKTLYPQDFLALAHSLEGLREEDVRLLAEMVGKTVKKGPDPEGNEINLQVFMQLEASLVPSVFKTPQHLYSRMAVLESRGLIVATDLMMFGGPTSDHVLSPYFNEIYARLKADLP